MNRIIEIAIAAALLVLVFPMVVAYLVFTVAVNAVAEWTGR